MRAIGVTDNRQGTQYNTSITIFFISYALFEPLTNALLKRLTPRIFFSAIIVAWGTIMTLMGLVTSYKGLLAARFMLGIAEAGLFPGRYTSLTILLKTLTDCQRRHVLSFMLVQELRNWPAHSTVLLGSRCCRLVWRPTCGSHFADGWPWRPTRVGLDLYP